MEKIIEILLETLQFIRDITEIEKAKFNAANKNDVFLINKYMEKEQALLLKIRGIDKKREKIQKELGFDNLKLKDIIEKTSGDERKRLENVYNDINNSLKIYKESFDDAKQALDLNIHRINKKLNDMDVYQNNGIYSESGDIINSKSSFTSRRV